MSAAPTLKKKVVIVGGGLQGCATAYYLKDKAEVTIVESTGIGAAASGKGGGFLARDWGRGPTKPLHTKSFALHVELAETLGLTSFRRLRTLEVRGELGLREWPPVERLARPIKTSPLHPEWLDKTDTATALLDDKGTAQVQPLELCEKLFHASGAALLTGAARGLDINEGKVVGVRVAVTSSATSSSKGDDASTPTKVLPCDEVVVAAGAWTGVLMEDWLPGFQLPLEGVYSSSMTYPNGPTAMLTNPFALFCNEDSNDCHLEIYPRPDGSVYLCGIGGSDHVRGDRLRPGGDLEDASKMKANPDRIDAAKRSLETLAPQFMVLDYPTTTACMRPCTHDALPVLGRLDDDAFPHNLVLATGHNCWGILWAPITGKLVADILLGVDPLDVDLAAFRPSRFMPKAQKRGRAKDELPVGEQW